MREFNNITDRTSILEEIMEELADDRTKKERQITMSLKDHVPRFRPISKEELWECTYPGCDKKGPDEVPTLRALIKTGAMFAGCREHRVCDLS